VIFRHEYEDVVRAQHQMHLVHVPSECHFAIATRRLRKRGAWKLAHGPRWIIRNAPS
jgi:hypothetical protein